MKIPIRSRTLAALCATLLLLSPDVAMAQIAASATDPVLPDPVTGRGTQYPASAATEGQAYNGQPKSPPRKDCTALNPCALPSSAPHKLGPLAAD